ncbi:hypothetical protein ACFPN1_12405 [Lysobacter yangpyeongensis]|uniref:Uncharacterized protein n=1 Tax=Lysobacter yangpyeongensis TaxID=346182 RepID=A0ABW0SP67_9GAMM
MSIWTGLLFLEGAVADVSLARQLADDEAAAAVPQAFDASPARAATPRPADPHLSEHAC